jgi:hypothetical protein
MLLLFLLKAAQAKRGTRLRTFVLGSSARQETPLVYYP